MKQQQSNNQQPKNTGESTIEKSKVFLQGQKDFINYSHNKISNGYYKKIFNKQPFITHQTASNLRSLLTIGKNIAWSKSATNDGDTEQEELDELIKRKPNYTEIESKETKEKRIEQSLIGEAF